MPSCWLVTHIAWLVLTRTHCSAACPQPFTWLRLFDLGALPEHHPLYISASATC